MSLSNNLILTNAIPLLIGISVLLTVLIVLTSFKVVMPKMHHDPLPWKLRIIWLPVTLLESLFSLLRLTAFYERMWFESLQKSGLIFLVNPSQFLAIKLVVSLLIFSLSSCIIWLTNLQYSGISVTAAALGFFMPNSWVSSEYKRRKSRIVRDLPSFLEYLQIAMVAGLNLSGALNQAVKKGPSGPLKQELVRVVRDMRAGKSRIDALKISAERVKVKDYSTLIQAVVQSELSGSSLGETLKAQAEQRRTERFIRAEKSALEAPVKLLFPLVIFIFPVSFLILSFPVLIKFVGGI